MSLKGRVFYVCFPLFLVVLTQMIHNVFMIFLGIYFCFLFKRFNNNYCFFMFVTSSTFE